MLLLQFSSNELLNCPYMYLEIQLAGLLSYSLFQFLVVVDYNNYNYNYML